MGSTIGDVAARAGLSTATVDRALNGRPGVSPANRQRVLEAARELGYLPSGGGLPLPARPASLEFYIPFGRNPFMRELARSITEAAASIPLVASCTIHGLDGLGPDALARGLDRVGPRTSGIGIIATDHPRNRALIDWLCDAGLRVVTVATDVPGSRRSAYVGVDNRAAGRSAGLLMGLMTRPGSGVGEEAPIGLFVGSNGFHAHREREEGFRAAIAERFPSLRILPSIETAEDSGRSFDAARRLLREAAGGGGLGGIYCVGAGRSGIVEAVREAGGARRPLTILHDITDEARDWLARDLVDVVIDQNARLVGEQAVIRLLGSIAASTPMLSLRDIEPRILLRENLPP